MPSTSAVPSRRDRLRAATLTEIIETARHLLVAEGLTGVTLRAISRDMGMTAPALYRYFDSLDKLLERLTVHLFDECTDHITARMAAAVDPIGRMAAASREFRQWSLMHPAEFTVMFASPVDAGGSLPAEQDGEVYCAAMRFCGVFLTIFTELWQHAPFPVPSDESIAPELRLQLAAFRDFSGTPLPVGAVQIFVSCWIRLYGMVALEVFGHLRFALTNAEAMFETELAACAQLLGVAVPPAEG